MLITVAGHAVLCAVLCFACPVYVSGGGASDVITVAVLDDAPGAAEPAPPVVHLLRSQKVQAKAPVILLAPSAASVAHKPGAGAMTLKSISRGETAPMLSYPARVSLALSAVRHYPFSERMAHHQGTVWLKLTIAADGHLLAVKLLHPCAAPALNRAALAMARAAAPYPPVPSGQVAEISVPVTFSLES